MNNTKVSEWRNRVQMQNKKVKNLRESSTSLERTKNKNFDSNSLHLNLPSQQFQYAADQEEGCQSIKNRDLEEIMVESEDDDIRRHKERINKHFSVENEHIPMAKEETKRTNNYNRKRLLSDSSSDADSGKESERNSSIAQTPNDSRQNTSYNEDCDAIEDYTGQIMQLFPKEKLYRQKATQVFEILSTAITYFTSKMTKPQSKNYKNIENLLEEVEAKNRTIKSHEDAIIEAKKKCLLLGKKIEELEGINKTLEYTNLQQKQSSEFLLMLKDNQKRIEEDNKYLKECIKLQKEMFAEKELVWSNELLALKQKIQGKSMPQNHSWAAEHQKTLKMSYEDAQPSSSKHFVVIEESVSGDSQISGKLVLYNQGKPQNYKENERDYENRVSQNEYATLHHPDSVSSKQSHRSASNKETFDNFIKESNVMKDSLLNHM